MGMAPAELALALRRVRFDPDRKAWRDQHQKHYESANPVHDVSVPTFLCGRSPLLGRTVSRVDPTLPWSTHETAEHRGPTVAAAMTAAEAQRVVESLGWSVLTEAQWEYVARCGGEQAWAEEACKVDRLQHDPRYTSDPAACNGWGIWGLGLGEWVADEWHDSYAGAPCDGSAWPLREGPPGSVRGGAVLHAPWQDSDEQMSCHAGMRGGTGDWRRVFTVRPVIALPWRHTPVAAAHVRRVPPSVPFDQAVAQLELELRGEREERRAAVDARRARDRRILDDLPGSTQEGTIRSVGSDGVYVVRLAEANAILRLPSDDPRLLPGTTVTVRIVGTGGVPDAELVAVGSPQVPARIPGDDQGGPVVA